jgi:hypothetical protein
MSGSTDVVEDFATPDRASVQASLDLEEEKKDSSAKEVATDASKVVKAKAVTVTPPESASREVISNATKEAAESPLQLVASQVESPEENKHVRFDKEMEKAVEKTEAKAESPSDSPSSTSSQRGLVSRRGGRCNSPARVVGKPSSAKATVLEFKTYRSPTRKRDENDTVPSLCSDKEKSSSAKLDPKVKVVEAESSNNSSGNRKPASISCDASLNQTSPLASHEGDQNRHPKSPPKVKNEAARKNNVSFSPVPPSRDNAEEKVSRSFLEEVACFFSTSNLICVDNEDSNKVDDRRSFSKPANTRRRGIKVPRHGDLPVTSPSNSIVSVVTAKRLF